MQTSPVVVTTANFLCHCPGVIPDAKRLVHAIVQVINYRSDQA
jgi:hypothetical protein